MKFRFIYLIRFGVDNAKVSLPTSFHEYQYDRWLSRMSTVVSSHPKHAGCVLPLVNRVDCYAWIRWKNLWLFVLEMHLPVSW